MGWCQNPVCRKVYTVAIGRNDPALIDKACSIRCKRSLKRHRHLVNQALRTEGCPRPKKYSWSTLDEALKGAVRISARIGVPMYPYECDCKLWHLTSEKKKRNKWLRLYPEIYGPILANLPL